MTARLLHLPRPAAGAASPQAVPANAPLAVALFNDCGDRATIGDLATSQALRRLLRRASAVVRHAFYAADWQGLDADTQATSRAGADLRRVLADVDAVVVHGGHAFCAGGGRHLLTILRVAQDAGLPTFLVNLILDDAPHGEARRVFAALTDCTVPDLQSAACLEQADVAHRVVPDLLFAAEFRETPVEDLRRQVVLLDLDCDALASADVQRLQQQWAGPVHEYAAGGRQRALDWRHAVANLRAAAAVVCGSHHATCLAMAAGVPFVRVGGGGLPFLQGQGRWSEYPAGAADGSRPLVARLAAAVADSAWFASVGSACEYLLPLDTFARLAPGLAPFAPEAGAAGGDDLVRAVRHTTPIGGSVLHAGAGAGRVVNALVDSGYRAWGADAAWRLAHPERQRYSVATPWSLPFADHVFATVVVSAGWLDHLELDDLDLALAELARVTRDALIVEVSGQALRSRRAVDGDRRDVWWEERLDLHGFRAPLTTGPEPSGPRSLLVTRAQVAACPGCGRTHDHDLPGTTVSRRPVAALPGAALRS